MLRLIIRTDDFGAAANVGGNASTTFRTIDIDAPEAEAFLRQVEDWAYCNREVVGAELLENDDGTS